MNGNTGDSWVQQAVCRDYPDVDFFADESTGGPVYGPALSLCARCPVSGPCLTAALTRRETFGVWGGTTPAQRKAMLPRVRRRRVAS